AAHLEHCAVVEVLQGERELYDLVALHDTGGGLVDRLARLERRGVGEDVEIAEEDLAIAEERLGALLDRRAASAHERGARGHDRGVHVARRRERYRREDSAGVRADELTRLARGRLTPLPSDQIAATERRRRHPHQLHLQ